jgi:eukaryotic-like serine/threonine-protein kinase
VSLSQFRQIERLGSGGFSEVWLCDRGGVRLALKILSLNDEESINRFRKEVRLLKTLNHPRIVKIIDSQLDSSPYWYTMPNYQYSLRTILPELQGNIERIGTIFSGVLEGIEHAHSVGIIHRDLKPENVLLNSDTDVAISDFGLGRRVDAQTTRMTLTGQALGTLAYMAPEQLRDAKRADHASDIFSLGLMLKETFLGDDFTVSSNTLLPAGVAVLVDRCTQLEPPKRFQNIGEFKSGFERLLRFAKRENVEEELQILVGQLGREAYAAPESIDRLADLVAACQDEIELLHEVVMKISASTFSALHQRHPEMAELMVRQFAGSCNKSFGFGYTDGIGQCCKRLYNATKDPSIRAVLAAVALEVGVSHNRWFVLDIAASLFSLVDTDLEALELVRTLEPMKHTLPVIADKVNMAKLHPILQALFASSSGQ